MNVGLLFFSIFLMAINGLAQSPASASGTEFVTVSFSGDLIIHEDLYKKVMQDPEHDFSKLWKKTIPLFAKADFSYVNLEGPTALGITKKLKNKGDVGFIYDNDVYSGTDFLFNYHPSLIDALKKSGIDIVSITNNHSLDRGAKGLDLTIDALNQRRFPFIGAKKANSTAPLYTMTEVKNFKIGWIGCTEAINGFKDGKNQLLLCFEHKNEILKLIRSIIAEKKADIVIITPHWGKEYSDKPTKEQISLAHEFLETGAIAVIGSHPHVLQPIEKYITTDKRETFIAYSLGNFVAYQRNIERKSSAIIYLKFARNKKDEYTIADYFYEPTTRLRADIFPARHDKEVVKHVEKYLGPLR